MKLQLPTRTLDVAGSVAGTAAETVSQTAAKVDLAVLDCTFDSLVSVWVRLVEDFRVVHHRVVFRVVIRQHFHLRSLRANGSNAADDPVHGMNGGVRWTIPKSTLRWR